MKIVSWNCRGLGNPKKVQIMKGIIKDVRPSILYIQETKLGDAEMISITNRFWYQGVTLASTQGDIKEVCL